MPNAQKHQEQAQRNLTFLESFVEDFKFNDWAITVAFYTCVHIIEFIIFQKKQLMFKGRTITIEHSDGLPDAAQREGIPPPGNLSWTAKLNHAFRNLLIQDNFPNISEQYSYLYTQCRNARYYAYKWDKTDVEWIIKFSLVPILKWSNSDHGADLKHTVRLLK
jgi:hypothetical protein